MASVSCHRSRHIQHRRGISRGRPRPPPGRRGVTMGVFGLAQASALMVGPGIGLAISAFFGYPGLFLAAAGTVVASLVCVAAVPKNLRTDPQVSQAHLSQRQSTWSATAIPSVAQFAVSVAYGTIVSFVTVVARESAGRIQYWSPGWPIRWPPRTGPVAWLALLLAGSLAWASGRSPSAVWPMPSVSRSCCW